MANDERCVLNVLFNGGCSSKIFGRNGVGGGGGGGGGGGDGIRDKFSVTNLVDHSVISLCLQRRQDSGSVDSFHKIVKRGRTDRDEDVPIHSSSLPRGCGVEEMEKGSKFFKDSEHKNKLNSWIF